VSRKTVLSPLLFELTITVKNYPNFFTQLIALLEENERGNWFHVSGLPTLQKREELSCMTSLVTALSGVVFGHHGS